MEFQAAVGLVVARRGLCDVGAQIGHVSEQVALCVLRAEASEVRTDAQIGDRGLFEGVAADRESADQRESAAMQQSVEHSLQLHGQPGQHEGVRRDVGEFAAG
jgi:hypothetical protein